MNKKSIYGTKISTFTFIKRTHHLERIIFELKEVLKFYAKEDNHQDMSGDNYGESARNILEKYNKTWDEIYEKIDHAAES